MPCSTKTLRKEERKRKKATYGSKEALLWCFREIKNGLGENEREREREEEKV